MMRPFGKKPRASAVIAPSAACGMKPLPNKAEESTKGHAMNLLLMTSLGAVDGTILLLAASGALSSIGAAVVVGLTVVSGAGAWIAAYQAFGGRAHTAQDYRALAGIALLSILATVAAAWIGMALGDAVRLHVIPKAVGVVLFLIGAEVAGLRLPRLGHAPLPLLVVGLAGIAEVVLWIP